MADLHQNLVPTIPYLRPGKRNADVLSSEIEQTGKKVGVLIPALYSDFSTEEMMYILGTLASTEGIHRVYIVLDRATHEEFKTALRITRDILRGKGTVIWNDNPYLREVRQTIGREFSLGRRGKGTAVWTGIGYVVGEGETDILVLHDADIKTYTAEMPLLLAYPIARLNYRFAKGFYARYGKRLYGRVVRLFYFPIIRALKIIFGYDPFLEYMGDFRYPLSGEMAGYVGVFQKLRIPSDWGMEVSILAEAYRTMRIGDMVQVQIAHRYDHKHRPGDDLRRMVTDIFKTFLVELSSRGVIFTSGIERTIKQTYVTTAKDYVETYEAVALLNGLEFNIHREFRYIELFSGCIDDAFKEFAENTNPSPRLPVWERVESALPGTLQTIVDIVKDSLSGVK